MKFISLAAGGEDGYYDYVAYVGKDSIGNRGLLSVNGMIMHCGSLTDPLARLPRVRLRIHV